VHALSYLCHKKYFYKYGYQIPISTKIGRGFQLLHFGNIVFNPATIIGNNCTVAQGVLIGQNKRGTPIIGNSAWIGANAILVGDIKIGNNVLIAPGAFINKDVPDDCLVIGNPSNVFIKTSDIINGYIVNRVNIYD
jgi:serine O-acetyltransferase